MIKNTGGPAFPYVTETYNEKTDESIEATRVVSGMTLRDYFAAKVVAGLLSDVNQINVRSGESYATEIANISYKIADAMILERKK